MSYLESSKTKKSVTRTIRLENDINDRIEALAYSEGVSVSFLVNKTMRNYVEWYHLAEKYGSISILTSLLNKIMNCVSDSDIRSIARWSGDYLFKDYVLFWFKSYDVENIIKGIRLWSIAGNFEYEEKTQDRVRKIVIRHERGRKWSLFYGGMFKKIFKDMMDNRITVENMQDEVLIQVPLDGSMLNGFIGAFPEK